MAHRDGQEVSSNSNINSFRDLRQTAELIGARLADIKPQVLARCWRPALLGLFRFAALTKV